MNIMHTRITFGKKSAPGLAGYLTLICVLTLQGALHSTAGAVPSRTGIRTGNAHMVVVTSTPTEGLEAGISRTGHYARGIALDMQGKFAESRKEYRLAKSKYTALERAQPSRAKMIRRWKLKAIFQESQSKTLARRVRRYSRRVRMTFYRAQAMHNKWLAIRTFTGQSMTALRDKTIASYKKVISKNRYNDQARIHLAALYHETRRPVDARREFAQVRYPTRRYYAKDIAYYYTAANKPDQAFQFIAKAIRYSSSHKRFINQSNMFDRLRADRRFQKLIGDP